MRGGAVAGAGRTGSAGVGGADGSWGIERGGRGGRGDGAGEGHVSTAARAVLGCAPMSGDTRGNDAGSMRGKRVIVTGASRGIGLAAAVELGRRGAELALVVRDPARGEDARRAVEATGAEARVFLADLSLVRETRRVARELREAWGDRVDVLVNNAGVYLADRQVTAEGFEKTFATNHLSYWVLTMELLDVLERSAPARIVNVASDAHRAAKVDWDDLQASGGYKPFRVYGNTKLMNIWFTRGLARRLAGKRVDVYAVHPGVVGSNFAHDDGGLLSIFYKAAKPFMRTNEDGARTTVRCATDPALEGRSGGYFADERPKEPRRAATNDAAVDQLFRVTEQLVAGVPGGAAP